MDPCSHLLVTALVVGHEPPTLLAGLAPDLPWYLLYPAWLLARGKLRQAWRSGEWPLPPGWVCQIHYASHSLLSTVFIVGLLRLRRGASPGGQALAWLLHILLDIPTHSRQRLGPRPFWPLSSWAYDGFSWADALARWLTRG